MKYLLLILPLINSCSSFKELSNINSPKEGLKVTYDLKKDKISTKYKLNKILTIKL